QSIFDNVRSSPALSDVDLSNQLAMFLFRGDRVWQKVSDLSVGERLRVGLAKLLLSSPPANCTILDEPTNNLDMPNIEFLEDLLLQYKGALMVISHDTVFLERLQLQEVIELN